MIQLILSPSVNLYQESHIFGTQLEHWRDLQAKVFFQDLHLPLGFHDLLCGTTDMQRYIIRYTLFIALVQMLCILSVIKEGLTERMPNFS